MTTDEKLQMIILMLGNDESLDMPALMAYLEAAKREILAWLYGGRNAPADVPAEYEMTQVHAVVAGYSQRGAENQTWHAENGVMRTFHYDDMLAYIRANVVQMVGVPS